MRIFGSLEPEPEEEDGGTAEGTGTEKVENGNCCDSSVIRKRYDY